MEPELFKTLGQVAGIGGIALGVFLLLFRDLIRKSIFPKLSKQDAYRLLRLIAILIWSVAIAGVGAWIWVETHPKTEAQPKVSVTQGVGAGRDINVSGDIVIEGGKKKAKD